MQYSLIHACNTEYSARNSSYLPHYAPSA